MKKMSVLEKGRRYYSRNEREKTRIETLLFSKSEMSVEKRDLDRFENAISEYRDSNAKSLSFALHEHGCPSRFESLFSIRKKDTFSIKKQRKPNIEIR